MEEFENMETFENMEALKAYLAAKMERHNNAPQAHFLGLSPLQMHVLLHNPLSENAPVVFKSGIKNEVLDQIPLFRVAEAFLHILNREGQIKLTPAGALPVKTVVELYEKRFLSEEHLEDGYYKLCREDRSLTIQSARFATEMAGLVRKVHGKLHLTKAAKGWLESGNREQLFKMFFKGYTEKFSWAFHDGYGRNQVAQFGWSFSALLLHKFGAEPKPVQFYAERYIEAFPALLNHFPEDYSSPMDQFVGCYVVRTFTRFFDWFGLAKVENKWAAGWRDHGTCTKTPALDNIFDFWNADK